MDNESKKELIETYRKESIEFSDDTNRYGECMIDIKHRINVIKKYSELNPRPFDHSIETEFLCLQFRSIFELIILSSLVANKKNYNKMHDKIQSQWKPTRIIEKIKKTNPKFYPIPILMVSGTSEIKTYKNSDYLTEDDLISAYNKCCDYLHAKNPFADARDLNSVRTLFNEWFNKITRLLQTHIVHLAEVNRMLIASPNLENNEDPIVIYAGAGENPQI